MLILNIRIKQNNPDGIKNKRSKNNDLIDWLLNNYDNHLLQIYN